jgi:ubiquitin-like modifier-activating enzyme ATG7
MQVRESDLVFLLTDTRESRWLPTLLCSAMRKVHVCMCVCACVCVCVCVCLYVSSLSLTHASHAVYISPTLLCPAMRKPCVNVALGFDTFVIMRHGMSAADGAGGVARAGGGGCAQTAGHVDGGTAPNSGGPNLGCYFCNDVVAPMDSTRNRTLDQQCTATRPGLSVC